MSTPASAKPDARTVDIIPPHAYPPPLRRALARAFLEALMSDDTVLRMEQTIDAQRETLNNAVLSHVAQLEEAFEGAHIVEIYEQAHEIRGLAETTGLKATGRIAQGLCNYLETLSFGDGKPENAVVALHVDAISRASRSHDEAMRLGEEVANELAALVQRKIGAPERTTLL